MKDRGISILLGLYQIGIVFLFLFGFFLHIVILTIIGGCLVVFDDLWGIKRGILKPLFPVLSAIVLAIIIKPFYLGIFWSSAIWHIISIPHHITSMINPNRILEEGYAVQKLLGSKMKCPYCQIEQIITMNEKGTFRFMGRRKGITKVECPNCLKVLKAEEIIKKDTQEYLSKKNREELERIKDLKEDQEK